MLKQVVSSLCFAWTEILGARIRKTAHFCCVLLCVVPHSLVLKEVLRDLVLKEMDKNFVASRAPCHECKNSFYLTL